MKVYLRAFELDDYKKLVSWRNDEDVWRSLGGTYFHVSSENEKQWIQNVINGKRDSVRLAICYMEDNEYIGNIYLTDIDWISRKAQFHIFIGDKNYRGKGCAYDASKQLLLYAFNELNLERIYLYVMENNQQAIGLYEKCGFQKEGLLKMSQYKNGIMNNELIMAVLREDFYRVENG